MGVAMVKDLNTRNRRLWFKQLLKEFDRIAIAGSPKSGKSTLSRLAQRSRTVFHSDDFKTYLDGIRPEREDDGFDSAHLDKSPEAWSKASQDMCDAVNNHVGKCVIEGVRVPHALRKGMKVDCVVWLDEECQELRPGQRAMKKAGATVLSEWRAKHPGVPLYRAPPPIIFSDDEPDDHDDL